jgi:hypothetical protein
MKVRGRDRLIRQIRSWQKSCCTIPPRVDENGYHFIRLSYVPGRIGNYTSKNPPGWLKNLLVQTLIEVGLKWKKCLNWKHTTQELILFEGRDFSYTELIVSRGSTPFGRDTFRDGPFSPLPVPRRYLELPGSSQVAWESKRFVSFEGIDDWKDRLALLPPKARAKAEASVIRRHVIENTQLDVIEYDQGPVWIARF